MVSVGIVGQVARFEYQWCRTGRGGISSGSGYGSGCHNRNGTAGPNRFIDTFRCSGGCPFGIGSGNGRLLSGPVGGFTLGRNPIGFGYAGGFSFGRDPIGFGHPCGFLPLVISMFADGVPSRSANYATNYSAHHPVSFVNDGTGGTPDARANSSIFGLWTPTPLGLRRLIDKQG